MKKAQFYIEIQGIYTPAQHESRYENATDMKAAIESTFIPYLADSKRFIVGDVMVRVHTYDEPELGSPMPTTIEKSIGEE